MLTRSSGDAGISYGVLCMRDSTYEAIGMKATAFVVSD